MEVLLSAVRPGQQYRLLGPVRDGEPLAALRQRVVREGAVGRRVDIGAEPRELLVGVPLAAKDGAPDVARAADQPGFLILLLVVAVVVVVAVALPPPPPPPSLVPNLGNRWLYTPLPASST